jgi:hypothetical protein
VKTQLVQRLVVEVGQWTVSWPRAWAVLTDEMKRYDYAIGASGTITYSAPRGFHDDCVMALALAVSGQFQFKWSGDARVLGRLQKEPRLMLRSRALV